MKKSYFFIFLFFPSILLAQDVTDVVILSTSSYTESENSVFINPLDNNDVLNSNNRINNSFTTLDVDAFTSTNGGSSWSNQNTLSSSLADPAVVIDRNGDFLLPI